MRKKEKLKITHKIKSTCGCGGSCSSDTGGCGCGGSCSSDTGGCGSCGEQDISLYDSRVLEHIRIKPEEQITITYGQLYEAFGTLLHKLKANPELIGVNANNSNNPTNVVYCFPCDAPGCCGNSQTPGACDQGCCRTVHWACLVHDLLCLNCSGWYCGPYCIPMGTA